MSKQRANKQEVPVSEKDLLNPSASRLSDLVQRNSISDPKLIQLFWQFLQNNSDRYNAFSIFLSDHLRRSARRLTNEEASRRLLADCSRCPACSSEDIEAGKPQADENIVTMDVVCKVCVAAWAEVYTLTGCKDFTNGETSD